MVLQQQQELEKAIQQIAQVSQKKVYTQEEQASSSAPALDTQKKLEQLRQQLEKKRPK